MTTLAKAERSQQLRRLLTSAAIGIAVSVGLLMILVTIALGGCNGFGGSCPAERPSLLEDDVFGTAAAGTVLVVGVPIFLSRPSKRRLVIALGVGLAAALFIGFAISSSAHG